MMSACLSVCLVFLAFIPGALCSYDYNIGGMVAAAVAGFFMLILVIVVLVMIVMWRDWYERKMLLRGIPRQPRRYWGTWGVFLGKGKSPSTLMSTPRSDRKLQHAVTKQLINNSRNTTLTRADEWLNQMPAHPEEYVNPQFRYEEKVKTLTFEPEEEAVIVADLLPANDTRQSQKPTPVYDTSTRHVEYDNAPPKQSYEDRQRYGGDENTVFVPYNGAKSDYTRDQQFRHTIATSPYHVKLGQVDGPPDPSRGGFLVPTSEPVMVSPENGGFLVPTPEPVMVTPEPVFLSPEPVTGIPPQVTIETPGPSGIGRDSPKVVYEEGREAVITFKDSDDEAGLVTNTQVQNEDNVLF